MYIFSNSIKILIKDINFGRLYVTSYAFSFAYLHYIIHLLILIDTCNISTI